MKKLLLLLAALFIFPTQGMAQSTTEAIDLFDAKYTVQPDGVVSVTEKIEYNFGDQQRHGIFRDIPIIKISEKNERFKLKINIQSVVDEKGELYNYKTERVGDDLQIKIGDANEFVSGKKTYTILYTVAGGVAYFSDHDEYYWNVTGDQWTIPIRKASAMIETPSGGDNTVRKSTCFTGAKGSTDSTCDHKVVGATYIYESRGEILPGSNFTVLAGFPKGLVVTLEPEKDVNFFDTFVGKIVMILLMLAVIFWYLIYPLYLPIKWYLSGRDPERGVQGEASAWYDPPKTKTGRFLTPSETGTLIDEHAGPREISALIVDLGRRGYLKIVEEKKKEFSLVKTKEYSQDKDLTEFETIFLTSLFAMKKTVKIKDADLTDIVNNAQKMMYESLIKEGYFPENPDKVRKKYYVISGAAAVTFNFLLVFTAAFFGRIMPKKTIQGVSAMNVARSLRSFLKSQERQLKFQADAQMMFERLLPFAIAFGVEKIWAERFKDISLEKPTWYEGDMRGPFIASSFTNSLGSSLSSFNNAATPTTSSSGFSSGFSSGGGFSGGGGGGGGGGSW